MGPNALATYLRDLARVMPGRLGLALVLLLLAAFTEGVGLLLMVPLLDLVGLDLGIGAMGALGEWLARAMQAAGVTPTLEAVLALYVVVIVLSALALRSANLVAASVAHGYAAHLRGVLQEAIARADWVFHTRVRNARLTQVLTSEVSRVVMATEALLTLLVRGGTAFVYVGLAMVLAPLLAFVVSAAGAALFLVFRRQIRKAHQIGSRIVEANAAMHDAISEDLGGIKITKSHGAQAPSVAAFERLSRRVAELYVAVARVQLDVAFWFRTASALLLALFVYVALTVFGVSTAGLFLLLFLFARLVPMAQSLQNSYQTFVSAVPAYDAIVTLRQECEAAAERVSGSPAAHERLRGDIALERVTVEYDPGRPVLTELSMQIEEGRTTAIVGPSGGGKSTLADLLIGLLVPQDGRVIVGGRALDAERLSAWRARIGYVPQDAFLFHDTVRANLLVTQPDAADEAIMTALRAASAAEFVARLPHGLDTVLGDRGIRVSGGERQRLALARALLRSPSLLVLDEATSNLDVDNERRVQRAIDDLRGSVTIVTIAHRIGTVRHADRIYVLDVGSVVESGTWDELLAIDGGRFRSLCIEQGLVTTGPERDERATTSPMS